MILNIYVNIKANNNSGASLGLPDHFPIDSRLISLKLLKGKAGKQGKCY